MSALPEQMKAVEISAPGGPEVLVPVTRPMPKPAAGELLVAVEAAGVNRPDVLQRKGMYPPPAGASDLPGLEIAGTVAAVGEGVEGWSVGDRLCALLPGGGYAEYAVAPAPQCLPIPKGLSAVEAASLPETFFTVWTNVFERARFQAGDVVLIHGGTSGIGVTAIQMVKAMGGRAIATAGSAEKARACEALGAERGINYAEEDFVQVVAEVTGGHGADVILDMVGGDYLDRNLKAAASDGRIVMIAFLRGAKAECNLNLIMQKRLTLTGSTLRARPVAEKGRIAQALQRAIWPFIASGVIRPVVYKVFPLDQAAQAHELMESSTHIGKIVLKVG
ncbi:MAG: NAD(P)H-quinone oxidoreductase [Caulobacteraceae bacterium]